MKILFVCLGNICRSPLAHGILQQRVEELGLDWTIDSAGTGSWHIGEEPDPRSVATAADRGLDITYQRARQFETADFERFDLILTMDRSNYRNVIGMAKADHHRQKVKMTMDYLYPDKQMEVPDPYWDDDGFTQVYEMLAATIDRLIEEHQPM